MWTKLDIIDKKTNKEGFLLIKHSKLGKHCFVNEKPLVMNWNNYEIENWDEKKEDGDGDRLEGNAYRRGG